MAPPAGRDREEVGRSARVRRGVALEDELRAVRRPGRRRGVEAPRREAPEPGAVGPHDVDGGLPRAADAREGETGAAGRPRRRGVVGRRVRPVVMRRGSPAAGRDDEDPAAGGRRAARTRGCGRPASTPAQRPIRPARAAPCGDPSRRAEPSRGACRPRRGRRTRSAGRRATSRAARRPRAVVTCRNPVPSGLIVNTCRCVPAWAWKAIRPFSPAASRPSAGAEAPASRATTLRTAPRVRMGEGYVARRVGSVGRRVRGVMPSRGRCSSRRPMRESRPRA